MTASASVLLVGNHGPVRKDEERPIFLSKDAKVYISPYAEMVGINGTVLEKDENGRVRLFVRLA